MTGIDDGIIDIVGSIYLNAGRNAGNMHTTWTMTPFAIYTQWNGAVFIHRPCHQIGQSVMAGDTFRLYHPAEAGVKPSGNAGSHIPLLFLCIEGYRRLK